ncbi:Uncharacterized protein PBTT_05146 [Plasmodiophora brassicae]|nr:hypothetical protein PBRA_007392 [Plasmodiophora brassicae]
MRSIHRLPAGRVLLLAVALMSTVAVAVRLHSASTHAEVGRRRSTAVHRGAQRSRLTHPEMLRKQVAIRALEASWRRGGPARLLASARMESFVEQWEMECFALTQLDETKYDMRIVVKELALLYEWPTVGRSGDWGKRVRDMLEDDEIRRRMERPMLRKSVQTTIWEHLYSEIYLGNDIPVESNVTWDNLRQRVMAAIAKKMSDAMRLDGEIARLQKAVDKIPLDIRVACQEANEVADAFNEFLMADPEPSIDAILPWLPTVERIAFG